MAKILEMPKLSPTMEEGVLSAWHKKEGDVVGVDDLLAEVETDKATMEFRSFDKGTIRKILVAAGATVKLGQAVAILGDASEDISALEASVAAAPAAAAPAAPAPAAPAPAPAVEEAPPPTTHAAGPRPAPPPKPVSKGDVLTRTDREPDHDAPETTRGEVHASPAVRKAAREQGIDLAGALGTGPHGRVVLADLAKLASGRPAAKAPPGELLAPTAVALSPMRKTIARRLVESKQTVPHFYLQIDIDAAPLVTLREAINEDLASANDEKPTKISVNDLIVKAVAIALRRVPECNAQFTPEAILLHERVDISVAVAVPDGLVTPVVRDADRKSVAAIGAEVRELAARAKAKKLKPEEMANGTFSISNLGMFGIDAFSAVINPPEGAILAVGQVRDEPVVQGGVVVPGKRLAMTLSCDHRVIDGAVGARFLAEVRALLAHPLRLLA